MDMEYLSPKKLLEYMNYETGARDVNTYLSLFGNRFLKLNCGGKSIHAFVKEMSFKEDDARIRKAKAKQLQRFMNASSRPSLSKSSVKDIREALTNEILDDTVLKLENLRDKNWDSFTAENIISAIENSRTRLPDSFAAHWRLAGDHNLDNNIKVMLILMASLFQKYYDCDYKGEKSISDCLENYIKKKIGTQEKITWEEGKGQESSKRNTAHSASFLKKYSRKIKDHYGRKDQFKKISNILAQNGLCLLHGKPGFGKSSLALKYCEMLSKKGSYEAIYFLACENTEELKKSAWLTNVKDSEIRLALDDYIDSCMDCRQGKLLFVFDNLGKDRYSYDNRHSTESPDKLRDELTDLIKEKKSLYPEIDFLITSLYSDLFYENEYKDCSLEIGEFTLEEAYSYLCDGISFQYSEAEVAAILSFFTHVPIVLKTVKILAMKRRSFSSISPGFVHGSDELYYLMNKMLNLAAPVYVAAIQAASFCYKDSIPANFIALCVSRLLSSDFCESESVRGSWSGIEEIMTDINRENASYQILDIYEERGQIYYSIHQSYQLEIRKLWSECSGSLADTIFSTYSQIQNFYAYYSINDFLSVRELKPHIIAFWTLLNENQKNAYKELWIHYRWIDEYFISSGSNYERSPLKDDLNYTLRFECDRLSNCIEDSDFDREELTSMTVFLTGQEAIDLIESDLMLRCRVCVFFMELINNNETGCIGNVFRNMSLKKYVLACLEKTDTEINTETDKKKLVFYIEHACMLRSMLSIKERINHSEESLVKAVSLNEYVMNLLSSCKKGRLAKLDEEYDTGFLNYFALNLSAVPQWESPKVFAGRANCTALEILENAYHKTKKCYDFYFETGFFERMETELGNLFDICGIFARNYKDFDKDKCIFYIKKARYYLDERYSIRKKTNYLSPEFMTSYLYKEYLFYTQYKYIAPDNDFSDQMSLLLKGENIVKNWEIYIGNVSNNSQSLFYRMKGVLYRKKYELICYLEAADSRQNILSSSNVSDKVQDILTALESFDYAISKSPDNVSVKVINSIEKAFALKAYGKIYEARKLLDSIGPLVEESGAWENRYKNAEKIIYV